MNLKLFDSEMKVMELIWTKGSVSAKELSLLAASELEWNKNTTYTVIKKLVAKGYIRRDEPGFICTPLISKEDVRRAETQGLIDRLFGGSKKALFSALLEDEKLSEKELEELRKLIDKR
ncbi:MAG: BlaI/MecI/CopY family transcriptional regulator [Lachnospiraceae bacterium]|nr:BlaI/MecI/CopY family transcriptional regulator [Lachnospiraceae bacterium]